MEITIFGMLVIAALKLAVFLIVLVYVFLASISLNKDKIIYWLGLMSVALIIIVLGEFVHVFGMINQDFIRMEWIVDHHNLYLFSSSFYLIAGIGILLFLTDINRNVRKYM